MADYNKIGLLVKQDGRILLCRKKHTTSLLILPGGCLEAGESADECLRRELHEELGEVEADNVRYVGTYRDNAAGAPEKVVEIALYAGDLRGSPVASAEIGALVWFGPSDDPELLSPILRNRILPDLRARNILW